ncbi:MAG: dihydrofolate reductase [Labilithrix sp.]|nr:dihydrofolate reductase [Labilithrix sp.]MBX3224989.1 dihydrofolate reductase [Labilithrix sp.]
MSDADRLPGLALVVAIADGGVIGKDGALPWRIPEDLQHFKAATMGHAIIMGRKTHASIGRPLAGRRNIVVSRTADSFDGCELARSLEEAIALARTTDEEPRIIGGARIYEEALPLATRVFLTEVHRKVDGDAFFHLDRSGWRETSRRAAETEGVEFVTLER